MTTLICQTNPHLEILNPSSGSWVKFVGGKLEIEDDDPNYAVVMEEASRNPAIAIYKNVSTCVHCGESFNNKKQVEAHVKDNHFDIWLAASDASHAESRNATIKSREGFSCDVCAPVQTFGTEDALAEHVKVVHEAKPELDGDGDDRPAGRGRAAKPAEIPAATGTQGT